MFLAKAVALTIVITVIGIVSIPTLSLLSQRGLGSLSVIDEQIPLSLILRWIGAIGYWIAMALIAFSTALLLRQTLIPLFALIVISQLSLLLLLLSNILAILPTIAGVQLFDEGLVAGSYPEAELGIPLAVALTSGWTILMLVIAGWRFAKRDS